MPPKAKKPIAARLKKLAAKRKAHPAPLEEAHSDVPELEHPGDEPQSDCPADPKPVVEAAPAAAAEAAPAAAAAAADELLAKKPRCEAPAPEPDQRHTEVMNLLREIAARMGAVERSVGDLWAVAKALQENEGGGAEEEPEVIDLVGDDDE